MQYQQQQPHENVTAAVDIISPFLVKGEQTFLY